MPNALSNGGLPPIPDQTGTSGNGLQPMAPPQAGAPAAAGAPAGGAAPPPPPTHEQTVAALRHFSAIKNQLTAILKDAATGKSDVKSKIIDGVTNLVAERILSAPQAVSQLANVPSEPLEQRKWLQTMMQQAQSAENNLLDHYGATSPHFGAVADHFEGTKNISHPDDHMGHLAALHGQYKGAQ